MRKMERDAFWDLIAEANRTCGQDMDASYQHLMERLTALGPQYAQDFHDILHGYRDLAYQYGLWSAASLMCENGCSDDGFIDFRAWLIFQGREVYLAALKDPDSLADVEIYGHCQFEELSYVGDKALESLTGRSAYDGSDSVSRGALEKELKKEIRYGAATGYPFEWDEMGAYFPRLCEKHLDRGVVAFMLKNNHTMWISNPEIQRAREGGPPERAQPQTHMEMGGALG